MKPMQSLLQLISSASGPVSGYDIVGFFAAMGKNAQSAGAAIARAKEYGYITICGQMRAAGKIYNFYK